MKHSNQQVRRCGLESKLNQSWQNIKTTLDLFFYSTRYSISTWQNMPSWFFWGGDTNLPSVTQHPMFSLMKSFLKKETPTNTNFHLEAWHITGRSPFFWCFEVEYLPLPQRNNPKHRITTTNGTIEQTTQKHMKHQSVPPEVLEIKGQDIFHAKHSCSLHRFGIFSTFSRKANQVHHLLSWNIWK